MTWPTHAVAGVASLWLLTIVPSEALSHYFGTLAAYAALGALLPDLDALESKIKHLRLLGTNIKPFFGPAQVVAATNQHRGLLHSIAGWMMTAIVALPLAVEFGWAPWLALLLGYGSHLTMDSATKAGIMLFYPRRTRYHLLPKGWRITTGSQAEDVGFVLVAITALFLLLHMLSLLSGSHYTFS